MFEERYEHMMASVEPSPELIQRTLQARGQRCTHRAARRPVLICVLCMLMVAGAAALRVIDTGKAPREIASVNAAPTFVPVADPLTLSVSEVTLVDEHELSFILTVRGGQVDPLTDIDYVLEGIWNPHGSRHALPPSENQPPDEQRYQITLKNDEQPILDDAEDTLQLTLLWYTTGDIYNTTIHEIDWSTVNATDLPRVGDPLIPLGGSVSLTALAYTAEDGLSVQLRWPVDSWETTMSFPQLILADREEYPEDFIPWETTQYVEDGWILHNTTFRVTRDELRALRLITYTNLTGKVITGDWSISIDLSALKAD